jgi:hypothetical protein
MFFRRIVAAFLHTTKTRCAAAFVVQDKEKAVKSRIARIFSFIATITFLQDPFQATSILQGKAVSGFTAGSKQETNHLDQLS